MISGYYQKQIEKIIWYLASCWYSFSGECFQKVPPWAARGVGWHEAILCSPSAAGVCFLSVRTGTGSAAMCETKFDSYMCVHFNATSWHLLEQCVVLPVGNALEQSGTLETCLTLSQQSQYDVFSTGERKNRCMLVFLLFVRRILWMASKVLRFLHVVLPFNSTAVARLDERCSLHKQLKSHVHRIF